MKNKYIAIEYIKNDKIKKKKKKNGRNEEYWKKEK